MIVANDNPADALDEVLDRRIAQLELAGRVASARRLLKSSREIVPPRDTVLLHW